MKYPNNLRKIRKENNVKANDLADLLEVTFQHYYALERGDRQLSATQLSKLSTSLGFSIDEIVGEQGLIEQKKYGEHLSSTEHSYFTSNKEDVNAQKYFRITEDARKNGIPPEDFEMALDIVRRIKNKDK